MIKHHPKLELIQSYVNGDLPASLSVGIKLHAEMCPICKQQINELTEQLAEATFELESSGEIQDITPLTTEHVNQDLSFNFDAMIESITVSDAVTSVTDAIEKSILFKGEEYRLPSVLGNISFGKVANVGKLSRTRLQLDEDEIHTNILHIGAGGSVPEHQHKGFELTVLLDGKFRDENGAYEKGDFIMLDSSDQHHPISDLGCLCYTVSNAPLHFTQGINKLLNPIGNFIY